MEEIDYMHVDALASNPVQEFPSGVSLSMVTSDEQLKASLDLLTSSMQDSVLALDLEWRPDFQKGRSSQVAMVQLASSRHALLIRSCFLSWSAKELLLTFLRQPDIVIVALGWDGCDERKMLKSFGVGKASFASFFDLSSLSQDLGYQRPGLRGLSQQVLGVHLNKNKRLSLSNWEARTLTAMQLRYAAFDVLMTAAIFRCLRFWHAKAEACASCSRELGALIVPFACGCGIRFFTHRELKCHVESSSHCIASQAASKLCMACTRKV